MTNNLPKRQVIHIIEDMEKMGFPNESTIQALKKLAGDLQKFAPELPHAEQVSIQQISKAIDKIEQRLAHEGNIPTKMYSSLNSQLIILKTNLRAA